MYSWVNGSVADTMITNKGVWQQMSKTLDTGLDNTGATAAGPLTASLQASIRSVRELCPQRVPFNDWKVNLHSFQFLLDAWLTSQHTHTDMDGPHIRQNATPSEDDGQQRGGPVYKNGAGGCNRRHVQGCSLYATARGCH